jgi:hypothetical protein
MRGVGRRVLGRRGRRDGAARPCRAFIVFHGADDRTVPPGESQTVVDSWLRVADISDDGADNGSVPRAPATVTRGAVPGGHTYTVTYYVDAEGASLGEYWLVDGMRHAYSGGPAATVPGIAVDPSSKRGWSASGTDPQGPDASRAALTFFFSHPMR